MFEDGQTFEQFLDDYYAVGPNGYLQYVGTKGQMGDSDLKKILIHTETNWYEYAYMKQVQLMLSINTELYKLLDKKPITATGNSYKYTSALGVTTTASGPGGTTAIVADWGTDVTEPTIATMTGITSGIEKVPLSRSLHDMIVEKIPEAHPGEPDWDFLKNKVAPMALWNKIDTWLGGYETASAVHGVDTAAANNIECIDRIVSNATESGATNYVNAAADGSIFWDGLGTGTAKVIRSNTDYGFGDAQVTLPGTAYRASGKAYNIMEELDTLMVAAKKYSSNKRYIGLTTDKTLNKIEDEVSPGYRYLEKTVKVEQTINGVNTRAGHEAGFDVGALVLCGVSVPVFTSNALPTKNSACGTTTETTGHFYLIDLDSMYVRVDLPVTFLETGFGPEMLAVNYFQSRGLLFTVAQLVCTNFKANAALKWIAA